MKIHHGTGLLILGFLSLAAGGCSSAPTVKSQAYASLPNHRTMEYDFPATWKAIEEVFRNYKVISRKPEEVGVVEMRRLTKRTMETDWIYGQSRDKYIEFTVNSVPRKQYLQTRVKYFLTVASVLGGTDVTVETKEEIERLNNDGTSAGYEPSEVPDPSRASEILEKINGATLAAPPITS
ncbi:MAG: hypothetical protein ACXWP5_02300 [Bdellovibrionota bacterium]